MRYFTHKIIFILFVLLIGIAYNQWIFHWGILSYGDWYFFHRESLETIRFSFFHLWISDFSLGSVNIGLGQAPTYALYGVFAYVFGWGYAISSRIIHLLPIIIFTPLLSYVLLWKLTRNKLAAAVGTLVYSFNTYFLLLDAGTVTLMGAFAFLPGIFLLYYETLESFHLKYAVGTAFLLGISSAYEPRIFYITIWILFVYAIFTLFKSLGKSRKFLLKLISYSFIPLVLGLLLNFYWLFSLVHSHSLTSNVLFSRSLFGDEFLNILYAVTLYHPFWSGSAPAIFVNQKIPFFAWLVPIGAFLGVYLNKKNSIVLFFGILALLGILLTKQSGYPFEWIYLWLYNHVPGFNAFREASKFYGIIALSYSVLIAFFIHWLWMQKWENTLKKVFPVFISIVLAGIFVFNLKPLITGDIKTLFVEKHIPNDYLIVKNKIIADKQYYRTLWVPVYSRWGIVTNLHPELNLVDLSNSTWLHYTLQHIPPGKYVEGELLANFINDKNFQGLVQSSSVRYLFVPLEDKVNEDDFFVFYGKPRIYYIKILDSMSWLKKVNIGTKEIVVYENTLYRPHIYITTETETVEKNLPYKNIYFSSINSAKYTITFPHVKDPFYMNFSETYDPNWKLHIGNFSWISSLISKNYFLRPGLHVKNDIGLNSFYVNPNEICKGMITGCIKNTDGTYTIAATLYYAPEAYMNVGLMVSGLTFVAIVVYLGFLGLSALERKYEEYKE